VPDADKVGQVTVVPGTYMVATGTAGLIEKLREALGAPTVED